MRRKPSLRRQRDRLWDALSDILEEPCLAIPPKLRQAGLRAIAACQRPVRKTRAR